MSSSATDRLTRNRRTNRIHLMRRRTIGSLVTLQKPRMINLFPALRIVRFADRTDVDVPGSRHRRRPAAASAISLRGPCRSTRTEHTKIAGALRRIGSCANAVLRQQRTGRTRLPRTKRQVAAGIHVAALRRLVVTRARMLRLAATERLLVM